MTSKKENGVVAVPTTYFFKMAKLDYSSWKDALPREFYQNSVDAKSSLIEVTSDEESKSITIKDNGCGMEYDTIKEKLLVLGGSKKESGNVGAFGKAKEILFFSWERYEIRTHNWLVTGEGAEYTIEQVKEYHEGTTCKVWIWGSEDFKNVVSRFVTVANRFQTPCEIRVNGVSAEDIMRRGRLVRTTEWADIYFDESYKSYNVSVRIQGQWMFDEWFSSGYDLGKFIVEIHGESTNALTSNRDSLKGEYARSFRNLIAEFVTETKSALDPDPVVIREKFTGTGKVSVGKERVAEKVTEYLDEVESLPIEEIRELVGSDIADEIIDRLPSENVTSVDMDRVVATIDNAELSNYWKYKDRFSFIGFQPDFHVVYEEDSKAARKLEKYMQWPSVVSLANAWTEVLKQIFLDIGEYGEFHVGFNFSLKVTASYAKVKGEHYFYLNPNLLLSDCEGKLKWFHQRNLLRKDLVLKGIHEITHMYCDSHNESFVLKSEWIQARTWKSEKFYRKIITEAFRK
jgi:hypothetical protein